MAPDQADDEAKAPAAPQPPPAPAPRPPVALPYKPIKNIRKDKKPLEERDGL
jgi:hypothetical protein